MEFMEGKIPVRYLYTFGIAGEEFFRAIKERARFVATRCEKCDLTYLPPKIFCPRCMASLGSFFEVGTKGRLISYTVCHLGVEGERLAEPVVLGAVAIDGTNGALIHRVGGVQPEGVKIGMPVEAVFKSPSERLGSIEDIVHFRPV